MSRRSKIAAWSARPAWTNAELAVYAALGLTGGLLALLLGWHKGAVAFAAPAGVVVLGTAANAVVRSWQMRRGR